MNNVKYMWFPLLCLLYFVVPLFGEGSISISYAKNFTVKEVKGGKLVTVINPWAGSGDMKFQYLLIDKNANIEPETISGVQEIRVPCENIIAGSTTMLGHFEKLKQVHRLIGTADTQLVNTPLVRRKIEEGKIKSMGRSASLNVEALLASSTDLVLTSSAGIPEYDKVEKIRSAGVPVVLSAAYMEGHPLARAEWLKFTALFLGEEILAETIFQEIVKNYNDMAAMTKSIKNKPTVFMNLPWGGTWYMPAGESYKAVLLKDAGAQYLWADTKNGGSLPLNFEQVYIEALNADFWLDTRDNNRLADIKKLDNRYTDFKSWKTGNIYNNSLRKNQYGGNDIYERGTLHPDEVLADLIKIFHPDLLPKHEWVFYQRLR